MFLSMPSYGASQILASQLAVGTALDLAGGVQALPGVGPTSPEGKSVSITTIGDYK